MRKNNYLDWALLWYNLKDGGGCLIFVTILFTPIIFLYFIIAAICGVCDGVNKMEEMRKEDLLEEQRRKEEEQQDEIPFVQLFNIDEHTVLLIDHIEYCPDETAFIRVVQDEKYTKLYKRKVTQKGYQKYITFSGKKYLIDTEKIKTCIA